MSRKYIRVYIKLIAVLFTLTFFSGMVFAVYPGRANITANIRFISPLPESEDCRQLPAPENLFIYEDILVWGYVDNAIRFDLYMLTLNEVVGSTEVDNATRFDDLYALTLNKVVGSTEDVYFDLGLLNLSAGIHHFQVRAIGDGVYYTDSYLSEVITHVEPEYEPEYEYEYELEYEYGYEPEYEYEYELEYEYEYEPEYEYGYGPEYEYGYEPEYEKYEL